MYYHASPIEGIKRLEPRISNHNVPLIYFSEKRENTLVYLSNAVEKYCRETGYEHTGKWYKWGSYGFSGDGILRLEEYYPNATVDTYKGVSAYIYRVDSIPDAKKLDSIPFAYTVDHPVEVRHCEFVADAYEEIMRAVRDGKILLERYEDVSGKKYIWIRETVIREYHDSQAAEEYRYFLRGKFPFLRE